jgi:hypothetical protein
MVPKSLILFIKSFSNVIINLNKIKAVKRQFAKKNTHLAQIYLNIFHLILIYHKLFKLNQNTLIN